MTAGQPQRSWDDLIAENEREYGEAWLPHKNAGQPHTLVGTVTGYNLGPESVITGERPWIASFLTRDGENWSLWLNLTVLKSEFEARRPMPGERAVVRYRGRAKEASRTGAQPPELFTVTVDRGQTLPEFLRPRLEAGGEDQGDVPIDTGDLPAPVDAEVVEERDATEGGGDDDIPF